jgi:hypothetical protein
LAFIIAFACAVIPGVGEMLASLGIITLTILGIIAAGLIGFAIYRLSHPQPRTPTGKHES